MNSISVWGVQLWKWLEQQWIEINEFLMQAITITRRSICHEIMVFRLTKGYFESQIKGACGK